jgi:mRNA-degrading endonuclease RelE of RelBE toxin-antitoxin system
MKWKIDIVRQAKKASKTLSKSAFEAYAYLLIELEELGPYRKNWPHYTCMGEDDYHCHIKRGRPTYVACWRIINKKQMIIEVYYAGTHEKAPY